MHCYSGDEEELTPVDDKVCDVTEWELWSECTASCGEGLRMRNRHFRDRKGAKKCPHVALVEKVKCMEPPCTNEEKVRSFHYIYIDIYFLFVTKSLLDL